MFIFYQYIVMLRSYLNKLSVTPFKWKQWTYTNSKVLLCLHDSKYVCTSTMRTSTGNAHPEERIRLWSFYMPGNSNSPRWALIENTDAVCLENCKKQPNGFYSGIAMVHNSVTLSIFNFNTRMIWA